MEAEEGIEPFASLFCRQPTYHLSIQPNSGGVLPLDDVPIRSGHHGSDPCAYRLFSPAGFEPAQPPLEQEDGIGPPCPRYKLGVISHYTIPAKFRGATFN